MLSIVNYGASDSENEITDDEDEGQNGIIKEKDEDMFTKPTSIKFKIPEPAVINNIIIEEDDDEFLHKKEIPETKPPPKIKEKVKIMIPKLSDFKDDDEEEKEIKKYPTAVNKKSGLLGMLPKPSHYFGPSAKQPQIIITPKPPPATIAPSQDQSSTKKIGLIPYALMDHKKAGDTKKLAKKIAVESDSDDEGDATSFFTFSSKDDELPQVSEEEIKSLISKETDRIEQRKRQHENEKESEDDFHEQQYSQNYQQQQEAIDQDAMKALAGGSKAKRSKMGDIQIVDLTDNDVLPNREEWLRKTLAGETSYLPTGQIDDKVRVYFTFHLNIFISRVRRNSNVLFLLTRCLL